MTHDEIDALCRSFPGAEVSIKWGEDLTYTVGSKMFLIGRIKPDVHPGIAFKVDPERFLELTDLPGIKPSPYLARARWIRLDHPGVLDSATLADLIKQSYRLVRASLTKKLRDTLAPLD